LLLWSTAAAMAVLASWLANRVYPYAFSKSREGTKRSVSGFHPVETLAWLFSRPLAPASRVIVGKDVRTFFRDNTQWSQLFLLLALIMVYLYNFSVLPLRKSPIQTFYLQNIISFLNIGLASFVIASLAVRFVFPAVSQEGFAWWIIRSSPLSLRRFLWTKFWLYAPPLLLVGEVLVVLSNYLLNVTPFMMAVSTATMLFIAPALTGLGIGLGAVYPRFETENLAQVATGFGGMIYMILSALFVALVVLLEAWPVYLLFMSSVKGASPSVWKLALVAACFLAVIAAALTALFVPMRLGRIRLLARESR